MSSASRLSDRLNIICENYYLPNDALIQALRKDRIVSVNYGEACLAVDRWFLSKGEVKYKRYQRETTICDPLIRIYLEIVISSLIDYGRGRPCDLSIWHLDIPPDRDKCEPNAHICKDNAKKFLYDIPPDIEQTLGLAVGTIAYYMRSLNGRE